MTNKLKNILDWLEVYKTKTNCKGVVLGLSGGKDSTVVAMLAKKIWGDNVFAVLMPNDGQADLYDAIEIAEDLKLKYMVFDIADTYDSIVDGLSLYRGVGVSEKAKTNIAPRIRMTILYAIAQTLDCRVIGTGNASEAYVGWTTKFGDSACDFNPIRHLTKTEVVEIGLELAKEFGLDERLITKAPSDGLTGKSDEDNFGFTYDELDSWIAGNKDISPDAALKITKMHNLSAHKRQMPYTISDEF